MVSYVPPTVGGDADAWGAKLNTALSALATAIDANTAAIALLSPAASAPVVASFSTGSITETSAVLTWAAPFPVSPLGTPTHYMLRTTSSVETTLIQHAIGEVPLTIGGLSPGVLYTVTITPYYTSVAGGGTTRQFTTTATVPGGTAGDMPNGDSGTVFTGSNWYTAADAADLSVFATNFLTWEAWVYLDAVNQSHTESENYIHFIGKGNTSGASFNHEWTGRYYNANTSAGRPSSFSAYHYGQIVSGTLYGNGGRIDIAQGGTVNAGEWMHVVGTYNYNGTINVYRNGILGATHQNLKVASYTLTFPTPGGTTAPVGIGSRQGVSFLNGKLAKVAIYSTELSQATALSHYNLMIGASGSTYDTTILATSGLVAYWKLDPAAPTVDSAGSHTLTLH